LADPTPGDDQRARWRIKTGVPHFGLKTIDCGDRLRNSTRIQFDFNCKVRTVSKLDDGIDFKIAVIGIMIDLCAIFPFPGNRAGQYEQSLFVSLIYSLI
jgi:hypothetical protein